MAVLPLRRINVLGPLALKRTALEELQTLGCLHLITGVPALEPEGPREDEARDARDALRYLTDCRVRHRQIAPGTPFDMQNVVRRSLEIKRELRQRQDRRDFLMMRIGLLAKWGDFAFPPGSDIQGYRIWFYEVPLYQMDQVRKSGLVWEQVNQGNRNAYVIVISAQEPPASAMPVPRTHTGSVPRRLLQQELQQLEIEIEDLRAERVSLTRWIDRLHDNLAAADDRAELARAISETWSEDDLFLIQGWVPAAAIERIRTYTDGAGLAMLERPPGPHDSPPTLLENRDQVGGGQAIVSFWQLPGYRSFDPSALVAVSFALFFAMIMADAGYAMVLGVLLSILWRRLGALRDGHRIQYLGLLIVGASLVFGVLTGGYFGLSPAAGTVAAKLKIIDIQDYPSMMKLAIGIGAVHLALGNALAGWRNRGQHIAWGQFGWAIAITGGLTWWLGWQQDPTGPVTQAGQLAVAVGLLAVLLFRGEQVIEQKKDLFKRLLQGVLALTSVTKAFGDVLSYLRLFALGLASASLAMTFNELAAQLRAATGGAGPFLATTVLLLGHSLNFALILMSAVVHGLRLNLIEFFNWSVMEEGYPFRAFRKRSRVDEQLMD